MSPGLRRRRQDSAQAVIETAIVLPLMLFLVAGFIALMLQVEAQQRLDSAVTLAAEASFQAPRQDTTGPDALPVRCRFAWQTFEGSVGDDNFDHPDSADPLHRQPAFLDFVKRPLCRASNSRPQWPQQADVQCDIDADDRHRTVCDAAVTLHYDRTPLAWAIFWSPSLSAHAEAVAPPFRQ